MKRQEAINRIKELQKEIKETIMPWEPDCEALQMGINSLNAWDDVIFDIQNLYGLEPHIRSKVLGVIVKHLEEVDYGKE